jgi:methylglutaconyl-CoA hydratase
MTLVQRATSRGVTTLTLDDPGTRNALGAELIEELLDAIDEAEADPSVRVIVLTNSGSVFCAGANLKSAPSRPGSPGGLELFSRFRGSPKPFVGRINGHCVAGGMGLAAAMDIAVAVDTAKFGFTEVRVGVAPAMISVLCLPKMRPVDAAAAFLRGNRFLAPEAARMGLIAAAVPAAELDREVRSVVDDICRGGPGAITVAKSLLRQVPEMTVDEAFARTAEISAELFRGAEAREGIDAFREKRDPAWVADRDAG